MRKPLNQTNYTDKQLMDLLPTLPFDQQIEQVIRKYVGGAMSHAMNGEHSAAESDAMIARALVGRLKRCGVIR